MVSIHRHVWLAAMFIVFAVAAFQIHSIHSTYMREDEEIAYRSTQYDLGYAVRFQVERDVQAPLWFASFWMWQQLMSDSEFMGRIYSIFLSTITMAMVYQIGRRWFGAARYGLCAMIALGVNAFFFIYSLEIRPYALVMLVATTSMWFFRRWLERRTWRAAILYGLTLALMLYVHYFLGFLIVIQVLCFLWFIWLREGADGDGSLQFIRQGGVAGLVGLAVWLPWLPVFVGQIQTLQRIEGTAERGIGIANTTEPTTVEAIVRLVNVTTNGQPGLYALFLIPGLFYFWRKRNYWLTLLWGLGVPIIALLINLIASVYTQRYVTYLSVGLALAVGAGLGAILSRNPVKNTGYRVAKSLGIAGLAGFVALNLWGMPSQLPVHTPFRDLLGDMSAAAKPGDVVFFDHADTSDNFFQWQFRHYLSDDLQENSFTGIEQVRDERRIWHVTAHWFDDEVRANFTEIERTHPRQMGFGRCDLEWCYLIQLMESPPLDEAISFGEAMTFWGVDVDGVTRESISTRLWWRMTQTPELNYSMSLQLLDGSGALVAQFDGPIHNYGQAIVETSQLAPGQIYVDHRSIPVPPELSSGEYRLVLVVYQPWDGVRLTLADGSDTLILDTIVVP
jgi:hypothetical protein